jgi:aryl-alcohol dehydrogenase-like predicted oxidoreductase
MGVSPTGHLARLLPHAWPSRGGGRPHDGGGWKHFQLAAKVWCRGRTDSKVPIEQSFCQLKTTCIGVMEIRNLLAWQIYLVALGRLWDQGRIGLIGITHDSTAVYAAMLEIIRRSRIDTIQMPDHLRERFCEARMLPLEEERVIMMEPLARGAMSRPRGGTPTSPPLATFGIRA